MVWCISSALVDKRQLVIWGDVSVCVEGSMQPQRPRRISLRMTTWRLLGNYKPTQMFDEYKRRDCVFIWPWKVKKWHLLQPRLTFDRVLNMMDDINMFICQMTVLKLICLKCVFVYVRVCFLTWDVCVQWLSSGQCTNSGFSWIPATLSALLQAQSRLFFLFWDVLVWPALPCQDPGCV